MRRVLLLAPLLPLAACLPREPTPTRPPSPDQTALVNGTIITFSTTHPPAQIAIIERGKFTCVGAAGECVAPTARVIDMHGGTAVPGLIDAHGHVLGLGLKLREVDLRGCKDEAECAARVAERAKSAAPGAWVVGRGWDQTKWPGAAFPSRAALDKAAGDHPVYLTRIDGHAAWVNGKALDAAKIAPATRDPAGGKITRDDRGGPSGVLVDNAMGLVEKAMPPRTDAEIREALTRAMKELAAVGLTSVHDAGVDAQTLAVYRDLAEKDALPIRIYAMLDGSQPMDALKAQMAAWQKTPTIGRLTVRAVKLYADGALGSRGAWLKAPYSDDPSNSGLAVTPPDELRARILEIAKAGFQPAVHAIGDRACAETLQDFIEARKVVRDLRPRIEHMQVLDPSNRGLLIDSHAVASMQPTHATSDGPWAELRLGHGTKRLEGAYAWKSVVRMQLPLACGSDFPVEEIDPRLGLYSAETRTWPGGPADGWMGGEALTRDDALRCFTMGGAYAEYAEGRRGKIAIGYDADVTVFDGAYFNTPAETLRDTPIRATIVGGRVEYSR